MKISTMTNFFYENRPDGRGYIESVRLTHEAGFKYMDFCGCPMQRKATEFNRDDEWERLAHDLADESAKIGVTFIQSHLPYPQPNSRRKLPTDEGCEANDYFVKMTYRCLEISAMLGVKWAVVHPVMKGDVRDPEVDAAYNLEVYGKYFERAKQLGVGLAFENMATVDGVFRFGNSADDLLLINEAFGNDPLVGVCWDFGHANRVYHDFEEQKGEFVKALTRLHATHVDDNIGSTDMHQLPYVGTVKWNELVPLMKDYDDAFNYEINFVGKMPKELKPFAAEFAYKVAEHLVSLV